MKQVEKGMNMKKNRGFTLIEIMIVVVIIGILASVAIPQYSAYILKGKLAEPRANLSEMRVRMERYFQDNRRYENPEDDTECGVSDDDLKKIGDQKFFDYTCVPGGGAWAQSYTLTATGKAKEGTGGFVFTINDKNEKKTTDVPSGWKESDKCWVTGSGGGC